MAEPGFPISNDRSFKCVILAAGASTRLRPLTDTTPKCLLKINDRTLLERTIENVLGAGMAEIGIVIGYCGEMIREFVKQKFPKQKIRFIVNPNFRATNNAYSLLLARRFLEDREGNVKQGLLLLDSDILFSSKLLTFFLSDEAEDKISIRKPGEYDGEEMSVKLNNEGNIVLIGKGIPLSDVYYESIGIELFSAGTTALLYDILINRVQNGGGRSEFYESSFQELIDRGIRIGAVDISKFPALEIDTPEDLEQARRMDVK